MKAMLAVYSKVSAKMELDAVISMCCELSPDDLVPALIFTQILHRLNSVLDDYLDTR